MRVIRWICIFGFVLALIGVWTAIPRASNTADGAPIRHAEPSPWPMFLRDRRHTARAATGTVQVWLYEKWRFQTTDYVSFPPVIAADGTIYVVDVAGILYAITPDGRQRWRYNLHGGSTPAIGPDGTVYAAGLTRLFAFNPDGTIRWSVLTGGGATSPVTLGEDGSIYFGSTASVMAYDPDGRLKWRYTTPGYTDVHAPAVADDGTVYIVDNEAILYALNPDGTLKWKHELGTFTYDGTVPMIAPDGTVYASGNRMGYGPGELYAFNPDGGIRWIHYSESTSGGFRITALGADGTIYVSENSQYGTSYLRALNPDGTVRWGFPLGGQGYHPQVAADGTILVTASDHRLYAVHPDGTLYWSRVLGDPRWSYIYHVAIGADGTLYAGDYGGFKGIYALGTCCRFRVFLPVIVNGQ